MWLTRQQICQKYGDKKIADCICDGKLADPNVAATQVKDHPDAEGVEAQLIGDTLLECILIIKCILFRCIVKTFRSVGVFLFANVHSTEQSASCASHFKVTALKPNPPHSAFRISVCS